jgi:hypothetical protein
VINVFVCSTFEKKKKLRNAGLVSQLEVVESAKVPIVKLVHALTQVSLWVYLLFVSILYVCVCVCVTREEQERYV